MALLEWGGKRVPVAAGELILGSDPGCAVPLSGPGILPKHAILRGLPDGQVIIRKATPEAEVVINGVRLGAEPTPLLHGDKVEVGGHELSFVDERRSGSTQYIQAMPMGGSAPGDSARAARPTGNTGGRVVSLTDGREYAVAGTSLVFGREATCDVVVPGKDVSRKHAEILSGPEGYVVVDHSTNGTLVNGERVQGRRLLARADVIAIGEETFRFYADAVAAPPAPSLQDTSLGVPAAPPPPPPPPPIPPPPPGSRSSGGALASFLVRTGSLKGQRLTVRTPVVNIGRADYNDFVITDESISTAHAKLQRREGVWILVDLESTNGSFIDGERVAGEAPLSPGSTVRLGEVSLVFEPTDDAVGVQKGGGTRLLEVMKPPAAPAPPPAAKPAPAAKPPAPKKEPVRKPATPPAPQKKKGKGCGASVVVFALGAGALFYWLLI
jgi:pSer/pThr/pTyr-binding forkhead associated (FHA) protein